MEISKKMEQYRRSDNESGTITQEVCTNIMELSNIVKG